MKKSLIIGAMAVLSLTSCEDFLDSNNYSEADSTNYPVRPEDVSKELAALYGVLNQFSTDPLQSPWLVWNIMSDDTNGAGGTGDVECHAIGHLMSNKDELYTKAWHNTYVGIARANAIIYTIDYFDWTGKEDTRSQLLGEAYFMRGLFYLWGTQLWGDIPAYWAQFAPEDCGQQSAEDVTYPHILADFVTASNLMKHGATTWGDGHAMKGTAEAFLGRAYMFYQGFYKQAGELASASLAPVELPEQEGVNGPLTKDQVIAYLKDCIDNSGAELIDDFRLLWQYTNELTAPDYAYVQDLAEAGRFWAGNGNREELFQVQFGNFASWSGTIGMGFTNMTSLYLGLRCDLDANGYQNGDEGTLPFGRGWGQGVFNMNAVNAWSDSDPRKSATVLDCDKELQQFGYATTCSEETGKYNKKWMSITCKESTFSDADNAYTWWGVARTKLESKPANNNGSSFQGDHFTDIILMRLSDVMLMHSELSGDATMMNRVRERAGLPTTTYSWENIKAERRWEFFGEGIRFNDLRRWSGKNGGADCLAAQALEKQNGSAVNYTGRWTTMHHAKSSWAQRYAATQGFLQIPNGAINIVANPELLKQNAGWEAESASEWSMTGTPVY